jgi:hypothetical protein
MRLEDNIGETAVRICDQLASAIERYVSISGLGFGDVPESFLRDRVFHGLGDVLTMTLETNNSTLWEWNSNTRQRWNRRRNTAAPPQPEEFRNYTRPDIVIFTGDHTKKSEMDILCLVEIKKWWVLNTPDLVKIDNWFRWLDTCPNGMLCGFVKIPSNEFIESLKAEAVNAGHQWVAGRIARPLGVTENHQAFARVITNRNFGIEASGRPQPAPVGDSGANETRTWPTAVRHGSCSHRKAS